ncbi:TPA: triose-phosphate isomerase [Candidatus Woesearchaeota archaeon]|nr:triose-phosphate isomerase [Candidatus Woesearchaeota archaeon]
MANRIPLIAGNWKMNKTNSEAVELVKRLKVLVKSIKANDCEIVVCPPFTALSDVAKELKGTNIYLGAQNLHFEDSGAFTGEVSAQMLKEIGCKYVIIGHSERRQLFGETNAAVNKKIFAALKQGLKPIVCVGETLSERERDKTKDVIKKQITESLANVDVNKIVLAYEPIWAIGTGKTATPEQAQEVHAFIRSLIKSESTRILYGGSVKPDNIKELMKQKDIDGTLVGGASLDAESFAKIVKY